jgi:uncharacterized protein
VPELISDTSPIQYLHQTNLLGLLIALYTRVTVPIAVATEIEAGRKLGINLPDIRATPNIVIRAVSSESDVQLDPNLGRGEREVLTLAFELADSLALLDDALARKQARLLGLRFTGTLGVLLKAKEANLLTKIPVLDDLARLDFRLDPNTRAAVLKLAGE